MSEAYPIEYILSGEDEAFHGIWATKVDSVYIVGEYTNHVSSVALRIQHATDTRSLPLAVLPYNIYIDGILCNFTVTGLDYSESISQTITIDKPFFEVKFVRKEKNTNTDITLGGRWCNYKTDDGHVGRETLKREYESVQVTGDDGVKISYAVVYEKAFYASFFAIGVYDYLGSPLIRLYDVNLDNVERYDAEFDTQYYYALNWDNYPANDNHLDDAEIKRYTVIGSTYELTLDFGGGNIISEKCSDYLKFPIKINKRMIKYTPTIYKYAYDHSEGILRYRCYYEPVSCNIKVYLDNVLYRELSYDDFDYFEANSDDGLKIESVTLALYNTKDIIANRWKKYVQNQSGVKVSSLNLGNTDYGVLSEIKFEISGKTAVSYSESDLPKIDNIDQSGSVTGVVTIKDNHGFTDTYDADIDVLPWSPPTLSALNAQRCLQNGTLDPDGQYFLETYTVGNFSDCDNLNSLTVHVYWKRTDRYAYTEDKATTTYTTTGSDGTQTTTVVTDSDSKIVSASGEVCGDNDINPEYSYDVKITLTDAFRTTAYYAYISTARFLMHFLHGGNGIAFGQKATMNGYMDCAFKAVFRDEVHFRLPSGTDVNLMDVLKKLGYS